MGKVPATQGVDAATSGWRRLALPTVLGALVLASFAPALGNGFIVSDDDLNLIDNQAFRGLGWPHLRWMATTTLGGHWQPLTWLTFAVDHTLWGLDPRGYHLTSLLLHAVTTVLVWLLFMRLLAAADPGAPTAGRRLAAAVGALAFGIHPLRVESVAWASERRDVVSGLFWVLSLLAYLRMVAAQPPARRRWRAAALAALAASLTAKAWAITLPAALLVLDVWPLRRFGRAAVQEKVPFALLAGAAAVVAFLAQHGVEDMRSLAAHGPAARVAQAAYGLLFYLGKTLLPVALSPAYLLEPDLDPTRPGYVASVLTVSAITLVLVAARRRRPWALAAWAAYAIILSPVLGLAQTGPQLVADRYTYLASLSWALLLAGAFERVWRHGFGRPAARIALAGAAGLVLVLATLTARQTRIWHDSVALWSHALALEPKNHVAWTNRGWAQRADPVAAIADYTGAIYANPRFYLAWFNRGNARHAQGDYQGAIADYTAAIALLPDDAKAWNNRGRSRQALGDWRGAADDYARALALASPTWEHRALVEQNLAAARAAFADDGR